LSLNIKQTMPFFEVCLIGRQNIYRCWEGDIGLKKSKYQEKNKDLKLLITISFIWCLYISIN